MIKTLDNGDQIAFDGSYYDFRDKDGRSMIKMWVPSHIDTVRGVFISGHGGGTGDSRDFARDLNFRAFAARFGFATAGLHTFPGRKIYDEKGAVFFKALDEFAALGHHPELANIPFCMFGSSNGGATSYGFINHAPERAICFVANVCAWFNPETPIEGALSVPGVIDIGMYDPFCKNEEGVRKAKDQVVNARKRGARWSLIVEQKGHEDGYAFDMYVKLAEQCINLRYPESEDPSKGPVTLKDIPEEEGWLADLESFDSGLTTVSPYSEYTGDKSIAGWLPTEETAYLYRAATTHENPVELSVEGIAPIHNPHIEPGTMFSIGGPIIEPGRELKLKCDMFEMPDWKKVEFYKGAEKIGEVTAPETPECSLTAKAEDTTISLTAVAADNAGNKRASGPFYLIVRNPDISLDVKPGNPAKESASPQKPNSNPGPVLKAKGLSEEQINEFDRDRTVPCSFWEEIESEIRMIPSENGSESSAFSIVNTKDSCLNVKAGYSDKGLYLRFEVTDDHFMECNPANYANVDALDIMIDSSPASVAASPANDLDLINQSWGIPLTTKQFQVAFGNRELPLFFQINYAEPWDFAQHRPTLEQAKSELGIDLRHFRISKMVRVQEWFLPWKEVGSPGPDTCPQPGTCFAFAPGYNDFDPGGKNTKQLRWVKGESPWQYKAGDEPPRAWGDIRLEP